MERVEVGVEPPAAQRLEIADLEVGEILARRHVQRPADRPGLHHGPARERVGELLLAKALEPRPERDVGGGWVLRLEPQEPLDRSHDRLAPAREERLPREQRAVELAERHG